MFELQRRQEHILRVSERAKNAGVQATARFVVVRVFSRNNFLQEKINEKTDCF